MQPYITIDNICHFNCFVKISFEIKNTIIRPGQHLMIKTKEKNNYRTYSFYDYKNDEASIFFKTIPNGYLTPELSKLKAGDVLDIKTIDGVFLSRISDDHLNVLISNGTGVSPFHFLIKENKINNYRLIHGIKSISDFIDANDYDASKSVICTSTDKSGDFFGRVTKYISQTNFDKNTRYFLCGSASMIMDIVSILKQRNVSMSDVFFEKYF